MFAYWNTSIDVAVYADIAVDADINVYVYLVLVTSLSIDVGPFSIGRLSLTSVPF